MIDKKKRTIRPMEFNIYSSIIFHTTFRRKYKTKRKYIVSAKQMIYMQFKM